MKVIKKGEGDKSIDNKIKESRQEISKGILPNSSDEFSEEENPNINQYNDKFFKDLMELKHNATFNVENVKKYIDKS